MADGGGQDVLGLKALAAQRAFEARGMSTAKALRRALSRSASAQWDLALTATSVQLEVLDQDGVVESVRPGTLLVLLDGPGGAVGLAQFDREILAGLTEIQTIQTVTRLPVEDRPLTHTDAAMVAPLIDDALVRFVDNLADNPLRPQFMGFRFGAMVEDARSAALLLNAADYRSFHVSIDLAAGQRSGTLSLFLPERPEPVPDQEAEPRDGPGPHEESLKRVSVTLDCVLARVSMSLARADALRPGDLIPLPAVARDRVEILGAGGRVIAQGRLGQLDGARAVRLNLPGAAGTPDAAPRQEAFNAAPGAEAAAAPALPAALAKEPEPEADPLPDLPALDLDFDFAAAAGEGIDLDGETGDGDSDGFAAATMDFDLNT